MLVDEVSYPNAFSHYQTFDLGTWWGKIQFRLGRKAELFAQSDEHRSPMAQRDQQRNHKTLFAAVCPIIAEAT